MRPLFPKVLDSSIMSSFRSCPRKFELEYLNHWKPLNQSVHLVAGGAYAAGLEVARKAFYLDGIDEQTAIAKGARVLIRHYGDYNPPEDSAKSLARTLGAFEFYFDNYPMGKDKATPVKLDNGEVGVEFSFAEPIDVTNPETGDPILYVGRMDMICDYAGGIYGLDDKTTSQLGASWPKQWDLRSQFSGYTWGAGKAGLPLTGFLIRGVSILKTKYDTLQALTYRPQWMIDRWYNQLCLDVERLITMWKDGYFDYNLDHACGEFGGCTFRQICMSQDPLPWLQGSFEQRVWNPVDRTEKLLRDVVAGEVDDE